MMSHELLNRKPERQPKQWIVEEPKHRPHPWAQPFGKPGERIIRDGNGWSVRIIHFPTGPSVVDAQGPLAEEWKEAQDQLVRLGFRPAQASALLVLKSYQHAEGDCAERERQQRRLEYVRYLVQTGRVSDGVSIHTAVTPANNRQ